MPRDFKKAEFKLRSTPSGQLARVEDLYRTITLGIPGTDMTPFSGQLSPDERRLLAEYVTTFSARYLNEEPPPAIEIPKEPPIDPAALARGAELYKKLQCAQCHGPAGRGDGESKELLDDMKHKVRSLDLTRSALKGGGARAIFRTISTGMNGAPMPAFADQASAAERWDLTHYLQSLGAPRGVLDYLFRDPAGRRPAP
jgi:cytochrome c oxidase cbb3-type subunit 2